jgi:hypothetical protein
MIKRTIIESVIEGMDIIQEDRIKSEFKKLVNNI